MRNIDMHIDGSILTVKIDLSQPGQPSSTGKTLVVASTNGNIVVPGTEFKIGVNLMTPATAAPCDYSGKKTTRVAYKAVAVAA